MTDAIPRSETRFATGPRVLAGSLMMLALLGGVGGWAMTARLSGAVIAGGVVAVDQNLKLIQHRDGGIVSAIAIREGTRVGAGEVLFRLDDAQTRAELSILRGQLLELRIQRARLIAERDDGETVALPPGIAPGPEAQDLLAGELRLFAGKRQERLSRKQQLGLGIAQIAEEIRGLEAQRAAKTREIALVDAEAARAAALAQSGLIEAARLYSVHREQARLNGEHGEITAAIARARARANEVELQILAIDETARTEAQRALSQTETRIAELDERRIAIEDRLTRTDIRAPIAGVVNELNVHTLGGVIGAAEVLATIVPDGARLSFQVKFAPALIDQVAVGQPARLRFVAFNQRTTPELNGTVAHVAAAAARDAKTGEPYFAGEIAVPPEELSRLGELRLMPGMPVEVFVTTESRTALSYLAKPLTDQLMRAFRER
ncbi:HlyD family type I secretion periplasmic adaptor subunit [Ruixingdingia sedimenti]|uniref:Membrane fusion protein (MFP) family protein n=1 Tax=Ruixingdingia sedimenti TaxID=3073604 RepID=A0ABU1F741_9RHOB|nr:HlyD family type I secretion periplasmic adaptor subunit [Xinfangfangia sp. LG-4]MDR5652254.1 HlyD family type I secretion periplasmic adaptor subunit [Xinfangfangia sp. LG-4]